MFLFFYKYSSCVVHTVETTNLKIACLDSLLLAIAMIIAMMCTDTIELLCVAGLLCRFEEKKKQYSKYSAKCGFR